MAGFATRLLTTFGISAIALSSLANPAFAGDPFRANNPKPIGDQTEAAFKALFQDGDYNKAKDLVKKAESQEADEPLLHALKASLAFNDGDAATFSTAATTTRETADKLMAKDKLRGNLYLAVGNFLEGAAIVKKDGIVRGAVSALGKVQAAFKNLDAAEKIDAQDPELNLIKGNIDLMLAVNVKLPLSDSGKAIKRLEGAAAPRYIADRSLAWGYRDLKDLDKAMGFVDKALQQNADNPDFQYLKAQIFVQRGQVAKKAKNFKLAATEYQTAMDWFAKALEQREQLPEALANQIYRESRGAEKNRNESNNAT
ncbi:hypothetical protein IQ266_11050 [filamentous cyanobacterium LEGE 11480]|uniref:Tetratricopeptide repeat protein n=1 Tax=Romeriopsis navalis LEGE 11480 TaxID=2777977 RepID=A0A928VKH5_9CYAN|nr:Sll0314/Alr1548 family TPR repeat-containing protein [Romeriopsis navalis]MBE9030268.1 hypothetical protein [Romeriopsis navalis LEGE 11480]